MAAAAGTGSHPEVGEVPYELLVSSRATNYRYRTSTGVAAFLGILSLVERYNSGILVTRSVHRKEHRSTYNKII